MTGKPRRWEIGQITKFILFIGPVSSIFDYTTFFAAALGLFALVPTESKAITISVGQGHSDDGYYNREHGYRHYHYATITILIIGGTIGRMRAKSQP